MIVYQAETTQSDHLLQEAVYLQLRISNPDPQSAQVPDPRRASNSQPVFGLIGPAHPGGFRFSFWSLEHGGQPAPPIVPMTIAPGETWKGDPLPLSQMVRLDAPGEYRISSMLAYQGGTVRSGEQTFRVNRPDPMSLHIGQGILESNKGQGQLVFLQREPKAAAVYAARFDEKSPANREVEFESFLRRAAAASEATDIASPWLNAPLYSEMVQFLVWREGRSVKALSSIAKQPVSFDLPAAPAYLVRPPLKTTGGPVEVMAVTAEHRRLLMVSVPPQSRSTPSLAWQVTLPAAPQSIIAALGPEAKGSTRHIAFVSRHPGGFDIYHSRYRAGAQPEQFRAVRVEGPGLRESVPVTMVVTGDDVAHVAVLRSGGDPKASALIEAEFGAAPGKPVVTPIPALEKEPSDGAILFTEREGAILRRDVVLAAGDEAWAMLPSGGFEKLPPGRFFQPIVLTPGNELSYILYLDPDRGFYFEPLSR